jgi:hypothetical protein
LISVEKGVKNEGEIELGLNGSPLTSLRDVQASKNNVGIERCAHRNYEHSEKHGEEPMSQLNPKHGGIKNG